MGGCYTANSKNNIINEIIIENPVKNVKQARMLVNMFTVFCLSNMSKIKIVIIKKNIIKHNISDRKNNNFPKLIFYSTFQSLLIGCFQLQMIGIYHTNKNNISFLLFQNIEKPTLQFLVLSHIFCKV